MIAMYKTSFEERTYFLYWLPEPKVIGVCNGVSEVYELAVTEKERAAFVNVSESILPSIWKEAMSKKLFTISSVSSDQCTILFGTKRTLSLKANNDHNRLTFIMEEMVKCIEALIVEQSQKQQKTKKAVAVTVKRRKVPKGIQWAED